MENREALNKLFSSQAFLNENKDCADYESIYAAVRKEGVVVTGEELKAYLADLSSKISNNGELQVQELNEVSGGGGLTIWTAIGAVSGCYAIGEAIGKFIYNITH